MTHTEVLTASALEQSAMIRARTFSSEELVRLYLARIDALEPRVHAFVQRFHRRAILGARLRDRAVRAGGPLPLFHGVPTGIKDLNFVRLAFTRLGTAALPRVLSPVDDHTASALRRGGFVFLGKLTTSELGAMPVTEPDIHPPTRNPWDLSRSAGGSSGGSGAAVSAGMLPIAQGSDGAGSVRIPSAHCHLVGIKPSRGRVANAVGASDQDILYTSGPLARTVSDAAAMLDVMAGLDVGKPHWAPAPPRMFHTTLDDPTGPLTVRVCVKSPLGETHPDIAAAVLRAARALSDLGHHVEEAVFPEGTLEEFLPLWQRLVADIPWVRWERTQPVTRWLGEAGRRLDRGDMVLLRRRLSDRLLPGLSAPDIWLTPTTPQPAPAVGAFTGRPPEETFTDAARFGAFTAVFNVTGQPAASVPLGITREGWPMGLQIAGRPFCDGTVLQVARLIETALPWHARRSPLAGG